MLHTPLTKYKKPRFLTLPQIVVIGYVGIILCGSLLLSLPFATKGGSIRYIDALFTSASATCVTGMTVSNTYLTFTAFGQIIILLLVQVGGLGFMTLSSAFYIMIGKRMALRTQLDIQNDLNDEGGANSFKKIIKQIMMIAFSVELMGAIILSAALTKYYSFGTALSKGVFLAISAFCNAGFDLTESGTSLMPFNGDAVVLITTAALIIIGGIGFLVIRDILSKKRWSRIKLHTKAVILTSVSLILLGTLVFCFAEWNKNSMQNMNAGQKILNAFFISVSARTAGFDSIDCSLLSQPSSLILLFLMFIGASPSSTGGGIKTTTLFVLLIATLSAIRSKKTVEIAKREISFKIILKALATLVISGVFIFISLFLLTITDGLQFSQQHILFEEVSAFSTVGLSMGIIKGLSVAGKMIIILTMFIGRVGMLTFFISLTHRTLGDSKIKFKDAQISI